MIAASVWMLLARTVVPPAPTGARTSRFRALTTPDVTVPDRPSGAPMATTCWPTRRPESSPRLSVGNPDASIFNTARSVFGSVPTMVASLTSPLLRRTLMRPLLPAVSMTWSLVTIAPSDVRMAPEPEPDPVAPWAKIVTTAGSAARVNRTTSQVLSRPPSPAT